MTQKATGPLAANYYYYKLVERFTTKSGLTATSHIHPHSVYALFFYAGAYMESVCPLMSSPTAASVGMVTKGPYATSRESSITRARACSVFMVSARFQTQERPTVTATQDLMGTSVTKVRKISLLTLDSDVHTAKELKATLPPLIRNWG